MGAVTHEDVVYLRRDGVELLARVYRPGGDEGAHAPRPALVEVHGGAWCDHDRRAGTLYNTAVAESGFVVVAIDFRMGPQYRHPAGSDDVAAAVAWVRANATDLGVDPHRVALAGSSSGGHLALYAALHLTQPVLGVAALWPPTHPYLRYRYALAKEDDHGRRLVSNTLSYFGTEAAMLDGAVSRVVSDGEASNLPPIWLVHPTEDQNVPRAITDDLVEAYRAAGGEIDVWFVPDQHHAFGHTPSDATTEFVERLVERLATWAAVAATTQP